jgi:hypothetical protein
LQENPSTWAQKVRSAVKVDHFTSWTNLSAPEADQRHFVDLEHGVSIVSVQFHRRSTDLQPSSIPLISATTVSRHIQRQGDEVLPALIEDVSGRIYDANLFTDAGIVLDLNSVHAVLMNPNYPEAFFPFDTYENRNFTSENYEKLYKDVIKRIQDSHIEIVTIIYDNYPAQVNGIGQSLAFFPHLGIHHIRYFNHMVQLVFAHAVSGASVAPIIAMVNEVTTDLQTPGRIAIMGRRCPTLVKTRWVYLVDVLRDILFYCGTVNELHRILEHGPKPESLIQLYWILLSLKLFSLAIECRERQLHEVLPLAAEAMRECDQIRLSLFGTPEAVILDSVTAHESKCIEFCYHCLGTQ